MQEHIHITEEVCPWCEQAIPHEKFAEISSRIGARENERLAEVTADLRQKFAREKSEAEDKSRAALEQVRKDSAAATEKLRAESAASVAAARVQGMKEAEATAHQKLAEAERARSQSEIALEAKIAEAEQAKNAAEQLGIDLHNQLEQLRNEDAKTIEALKKETATKEAAAREEGRQGAVAAMQERLAEAERLKAAAIGNMQAKIDEAEQAKNAAEQLGVGFSNQLEQLRNEDAKTIESLKQETATREAAAHEEGRQGAEAAMQERLVEAERLRTAAIENMQVKVTEAEQAKQTVEEELQQLKQGQETVLNERLQEVREALEKDKVDALNAEKSKAFEENLKLQGTVQELQRRLDNKSAEELGEGAEVDLYEALKAEFPEDRIDRVCKGTPGADIIHVVVHNGKECGTIIYDSKNRNAWRGDYITKLAQDQMAAKAEHAVLSTHKFPADARQLCVQDGIILANPARVVALVQVLRKHILQVQTLRLSNEARTQKTAALYDFITSELCSQLFERIDTHTDDLLDLEVKEKKAHDSNWKRRGELIRSVQRVRAEMSSEIDRIIGTASALDETL